MKGENPLEKKIEALERELAFHRLITENTMDMISRHDPNGVFVFASPASVELIGYTPEELIGRNVYDFFHPDDLENIRVSHREILKAPITYTVSYRFRHKDGSYVWVEARSKTLNNPKTGEIEEIIAATRGISARKQAEEALERRLEFERVISGISTKLLGLNSEQLDRGIEYALETIATISGADRAYVFLYHEDGLMADNTHEWCALGIKPQIENLKNISISEQLPWFFKSIHKQDLFSLADLSELPPEARLEHEHLESQGIQSLIVVPMSVGDQLLGYIGFDAVSKKRDWTEDHKTVLRLFGKIFSNAVERRRAEAELRKSEERWQFALEGAGDGVWDWDAVTNQVYFSKQWKAMLGYAENEIGNTLDEWKNRVHPDDMEDVMADLDRHFSGETAVYQNKHRVLCKNGTYKWILDRGKVIAWTQDGKPKRVIGTHSDISAQKDAEAERENLISDLQEALKKVKTLSGLLPICSFCKKIRDDQGYWRQIESYIRDHSEAEFTHSLCQECAKKHYPDLNIK